MTTGKIGPLFAVAEPDVVEDKQVVTVVATDPLTRIGTTQLIAGASDLRVLDADERRESASGTTVSVFATGRLDEASTVEVRRLARDPSREVVLVADPLREPELLAVLECGVRGIVRRDHVTRDELIATIRAAARGESRVPPDLLGQLMDRFGRSRQPGGDDEAASLAAGLRPQEVRVLALLADGLETRDVAAELSYSERTIKNVIYGLTSRLRLRNRTQAVAYAFREGYL